MPFEYHSWCNAVETRYSHCLRSQHQGNKSFPGASKRYLNNFINIIVEDNGSVIDDKEKIFYPFFTTKKEGKGIGLFMVKKLINHFNGLIFVDSDDTKTQFKIFLPIWPK